MTEAVKRRPRHWGHALVGLAIVLAGVFAYMAMLDVPWARSSGLPAWVLMAFGVGVAIRAVASDRRVRVLAPAGLAVALAVMFALAFFVLAKTPTSPGFEAMAAAPDFTLVDGNGESHDLSDAVAQGPVLLVFYRGHW